MMEMKPVSSKMLRKVGYDLETKRLYAEFKNGAIYQYEGVPAGEHAKLMKAKSLGQHFNAKIAKVFTFNRV